MRTKTNTTSRLAGTLMFALLTAASYGQSFNVDLDVFFGNEANGNGAPSASFGGAASQVGFWNRVNCLDPGPAGLSGLDGSSTGVIMRADNTGAGGGSNFPINNGDFARLLNDYAVIPDQMSYRFSGLSAGSYRVFTYAVNAAGETWPVDVSVDGATQGIETVTGPMPGNTFEYLVTHSIHDVPSLSGDLVIHLASPWPKGYVNGFQIVAVPEGGPFLALAVGSALAARFGGKV